MSKKKKSILMEATYFVIIFAGLITFVIACSSSSGCSWFCECPPVEVNTLEIIYEATDGRHPCRIDNGVYLKNSSGNVAVDDYTIVDGIKEWNYKSLSHTGGSVYKRTINLNCTVTQKDLESGNIDFHLTICKPDPTCQSPKPTTSLYYLPPGTIFDIILNSNKTTVGNGNMKITIKSDDLRRNTPCIACCQ